MSRVINVYLPAGADQTTTRDIGRMSRAADEYINALTFAYALDETKGLKITIEYDEETK